MLSVEDHLAQCLAAVDVLPAREATLTEALDCLLAQDVSSGIDLPGFANSAMDGYAVLVPDVATASEQHPVRLPVSADVPAGPTEPIRLTRGSAVRIMTGAPTPQGTDAIVPVEWTDGGVDSVEISRSPTAGQYVRGVGEDVRAGELLLRAGTWLSPRHIALLAAVGHDRVLVHPRPRIVVVSTGSELVPPGQPLGYGQVYDSNGYGLAAAATELGATARHAGFVSDDEDDVLRALLGELEQADLVVTSGGVSAGAYDAVKAVLTRLGTVRFDKVAMQPGMPQGFGAIGERSTPIFTLPGNPVSAMVSFEVFVRPVIRKLAGETTLHRHAVTARAAVGWRSPDGKRQFVRAVLERIAASGPGLGSAIGTASGPVVGGSVVGGSAVSAWVRPVGGQGSHLVADLAGATCLAVVPEDVTRVEAGDELRCLLLDRTRR